MKTSPVKGMLAEQSLDELLINSFLNFCFCPDKPCDGLKFR